MTKKQENLNKRDELVNNLAKNIVDSATDIVQSDQDEKELDAVKLDIVDKIRFEVSVLLNEVVTKISPSKSIAEITKEPERNFERFGKNFRAQHMLMFVSVIILIITGMPLKFPEYGLSKFVIITMLGGLENSTLIHRIGAVGLIIVGVWHLVYTVFSRFGRRDFMLMIPKPQDIKDFFHTLMYFFGKRSSGPKFGRFSFIEKFDYWAVYWGMVIMIGSGLIMWFKELFPKVVFDIGREAHSDEGLLATLAIVIWHFYNVHFNPEVFPMSWAWWHGNLTESEMKHHHALEYAEIIKQESQVIIESEKSISASESEQ
jgi:cytochrome b subunit of formate dehydrogenase